MSELITARLRLRHFTPDDGEALAALHGDPAVMRLIDDGRPVPRDVVPQETLPEIVAEYATLPDGGIELGYRLLPRVWGQGLATQARGRSWPARSTNCGCRRSAPPR